MKLGVRVAFAFAGALAFAAVGSCSDNAPAKRPNVLWIVWDTVRADRLGVYGYERPTTPFVDQWAKKGRVFEDCISAASWTVPSHASMFTGLLPSEHGAEHESEVLCDDLVTIAELLTDSGYQSFCWTANPHVSGAENATQGFEVEQHPWDAATIERAREIYNSKLATFPADSEQRRRGEREKNSEWVLKAAGELAQEGLTQWLGARDKSRPYFAFLNYMEAHRPLIAPREFREKVMTPEQVDASYNSEIDWPTTWSYCFGLAEIEPKDLELLSLSYDASLRELDSLFEQLIGALDAAGELDDTIIVLTADHGEQITEHHMLDHQYSLAQVLVHVPLIVNYPARFAPGRETRPVMSMDLFPTLLELAGVTPPKRGVGHARSLLNPAEHRPRVTQYTKAFAKPLSSAKVAFPDRDFSSFERPIVAVIDQPWKLVREVGGATRLYDLSTDPYETADLSGSRPEELKRLQKQLGGVLVELRPLCDGAKAERSEELNRMLEQIGYAR